MKEGSRIKDKGSIHRLRQHRLLHEIRASLMTPLLNENVTLSDTESWECFKTNMNACMDG